MPLTPFQLLQWQAGDLFNDAEVMQNSQSAPSLWQTITAYAVSTR